MYTNGKSHRMDFFGRTDLTFKWSDREYYIFLKFRISNALRDRYIISMHNVYENIVYK